MALPSSGLITLGLIGFEAAIPQPYTLTKLLGKMGAPASGLIRLSDFYGKSNAFTLTISAPVANPDIHQLARNAGWGGSGPLIVNFNCPYVNSLRLDGSKTFPGGLALNIMAGCLVGGVVNGGTALYTRVPVSVYGAGTLAGGGGKGGSGRGYFADQAGVPPSSGTRAYGDGGTGGGGQGFANTSSLAIYAATAGSAGVYAVYQGDVIGGTQSWARGCPGGDGGSWGLQGSSGSTSGGGYGGYYLSAGINSEAGGGDLGGLYVDGNSFVTWGALGSRLGRAAN